MPAGMAYQAVGVGDVRPLPCRKGRRAGGKGDIDRSKVRKRDVGLTLRLRGNRFRQIMSSDNRRDTAHQDRDCPN
jgi:hypothetical protein